MLAGVSLAGPGPGGPESAKLRTPAELEKEVLVHVVGAPETWRGRPRRC